MNEPDFPSILNAFSSPILIAKPIHDGSKVIDFELVFANDSFYSSVSPKISACKRFSEFKDMLNHTVPWIDLGDKAMNGIFVAPIDYFSELSNSWFELQIRGSKDGMIVVNLTDITEKKNNEQKLRDTAFLDSLTSLPNRNQFNEEFPHMLERAEFEGNKLGLLLINIDNIKNINDAKGHQAGDEIIKKAAQILGQFKKE